MSKFQQNGFGPTLSDYLLERLKLFVVKFGICGAAFSLTFGISQSNAQTLNRFLPIPPLDQPAIMGSCAPIESTADGGYLLNFSYGYPNWDAAYPLFSEVVKVNSSFVPQWRKELGGENGQVTFTYSDGTAIFYSEAYNANLNIEKVDEQGQVLWTTNYQRTSPLYLSVTSAAKWNSTLRFGLSIGQKDGFGYSIYSYPCLLNIDTDGNFVSADSMIVAGSSLAAPLKLTYDSNGNCYVIGNVYGSGEGTFLVKLSLSGSVLWCKMLDFSGDTPSITSLLILANGDILIGGILLNNVASTGAMIVVRLDQNGDLIWSKTVNHPSSVDDLAELPNGDILITGSLREFYNTPPNKTTLIKADANGTALWTRQYGDGFALSRPYLVDSNDWYFTSFTEAPHVFNTDSLGGSVCESEPFSLVFQNLPVSVSASTCVLHPITLAASTFASNMTENQPYQDSCVYVATGIIENLTSKSLTVFPNPANQLVTLEFDNSEHSTFQLTLTDALGRTVYQEIVKGPTIQLMTDIFPDGLYYFRLTSTENSEHVAGKFVVKKK
jgi:hypothetical protein